MTTHRKLRRSLVAVSLLAIVAACGGGSPATNNQAATNMPLSVGNDSAQGIPSEPEPMANNTAAAERPRPAPTRAPPQPRSDAKATPARRASETERAAPRPEPTPAPPATNCAPEHRAAGHC